MNHRFALIITVFCCLSFIAQQPARAAYVEDVSQDVPLLEKLRITAEALYECGEDNNAIASSIVDYGSLERSVHLIPVELGPNGMNLAKHLETNVFYPQGAYAAHLTREMQVRLTHAFLRVLWSVELTDVTFFEVVCDVEGKVPGDGETIKAPAALGVLHDGRLLMLRGISFD